MSDSSDRFVALRPEVVATPEQLTGAAYAFEGTTAMVERLEDEVADMRRDGKWMGRLAGAALAIVIPASGFLWRSYSAQADELAALKTEFALLKQRVEYVERDLAPPPAYRSVP